MQRHIKYKEEEKLIFINIYNQSLTLTINIICNICQYNKKIKAKG
ncbi:Uncharacterised protein [Orientia tsutsugamushi]|uniref:Uncharacterized protein n=1 Tax=Orientia tsutsugamushi TaxID=784 RepID=A0A2U3REH9_ORITS|nr:hypothetical protein [Orientia tsutsugamushi]KJV70390.1 hypothetical protein OTSUT76_3996 [Orientia tsutsugamushi str. UT76]KJV72809.1 hypothetical protein OTSTA763_1820 [Orientia tsutsugamushi str. TA763]KJV76408.1 hypothetical protein OTSUT76_2531 [Orientia tsutsugamushi str. UT76]SPP25280.1 Uncharacterised protein [Orientia tsutsugamushi]SPR11550.1 Uncharacterised protein [Orientia tsutsugamushi]